MQPVRPRRLVRHQRILQGTDVAPIVDAVEAAVRHQKRNIDGIDALDHAPEPLQFLLPPLDILCVHVLFVAEIPPAQHRHIAQVLVHGGQLSKAPVLVPDRFGGFRVLLRGRTSERFRKRGIVLVDAQQPFGNEHLLPRGTLREPPEHIRRADTIFITKSDGETAGLRARIRKHNPTAGIIECVHWPLFFEDVFNPEQREQIGWLKGKKVATLSGIAQPESFEQSLTQQGAELVYAKRFADHHRFNQQEILNTINRAKKRRADVILTTQKDAVRFPKIDRRDLPIFYMRVEIKILSGAKDFDDCVRKICFR